MLNPLGAFVEVVLDDRRGGSVCVSKSLPPPLPESLHESIDQLGELLVRRSTRRQNLAVHLVSGVSRPEHSNVAAVGTHLDRFDKAVALTRVDVNA